MNSYFQSGGNWWRRRIKSVRISKSRNGRTNFFDPTIFSSFAETLTHKTLNVYRCVTGAAATTIRVQPDHRATAFYVTGMGLVAFTINCRRCCHFSVITLMHSKWIFHRLGDTFSSHSVFFGANVQIAKQTLTTPPLRCLQCSMVYVFMNAFIAVVLYSRKTAQIPI